MRANANWKGKLVLAVRAVVATATLCCRRLIRPAFWQGHGYELDRTHGGMRLGVATPKMASRELAELGFEVIDGPLARNHPAKFVLYATGWYYLAALARS